MKSLTLILKCSNIRQEYGINDEDTVLFFMGHLYNFAGLKEIALELAKDNHPNLKLLIVGDGDAYHRITKYHKRT